MLWAARCRILFLLVSIFEFAFAPLNLKRCGSQNLFILAPHNSKLCPALCRQRHFCYSPSQPFFLYSKSLTLMVSQLPQYPSASKIPYPPKPPVTFSYPVSFLITSKLIRIDFIVALSVNRSTTHFCDFAVCRCRR